MFYLLRSGCQWRMLAREFPPWSTVHHYFRMWRLDGTWGERANHRLALSQSRRMSKDYERLCESSQAMISAVMSRLMLRRLARA